jgi:hypothetical protein
LNWEKRLLTWYSEINHQSNQNPATHMKTKIKILVNTILTVALMAIAIGTFMQPIAASASGGSSSGGGGGSQTDSIKVSKCYYDAPTGEMLIKASSSDTSAHLYAYTPSGTYLGEVQNGGGSRYGGTVMGYVGTDPVYVIIISSAGGSITVPTTPFQI